MATTLAQQQCTVPATSNLPGRRFDHVFFPGVAWLMLIVVFVGFAPSYYLAGALRGTAAQPRDSCACHGVFLLDSAADCADILDGCRAGRCSSPTWHRRLYFG